MQRPFPFSECSLSEIVKGEDAMISAKELNKIYKESNRVRQSIIIAKKCVDLLEKKLKETAESGFL